MAKDQIVVQDLELWCRIGVPEAERAEPQRLTATLLLEPARGIAELRDDVARTVDYATVCKAVQDLAQTKPRRLVETLVEEIAALLLSRFPLTAIEVEVKKFILKETSYVSVRARRERR